MHWKKKTPWNGLLLAETDVDNRQFTQRNQNTPANDAVILFSLSSLLVIFYIVWNFVMKIPSHHAYSHYRQNDKFVFFFKFSFTACQIELFHVSPRSWSRTVHIWCTWPAATWRLRQQENWTPGGGGVSDVVASLGLLILWGENSVSVGRGGTEPPPSFIHTKWNRFYCLHAHIQSVPWQHRLLVPFICAVCARRGLVCVIACWVSGYFHNALVCCNY